MLLTVLTAASYLISALLLYSGTVGVLWPLHTARTLFAVPNATPDTATFYPGLAGRNVTCGLAILTLLLQGQKQAAGVVVVCLLCNGASDCLVLVRREGGERLEVHVFNMFLVGAVGTGLVFLA
ncbi:hypothetical protein DPSP01_004739 [Paraphaeosphaeria sporulosa]|uniref:DUF4267 domain-containing protein n=1 Tax=Paraphaeosphaeria sporulosa TaxID=1460663 RepID=A0A177CAY9_9PLEO|nr:uncharacterized protein CC84DRAFT_1166095 [Paraphaeosphaeria sporulosa]OAG03948.1 hypothetical protein CC84DRAFT_1166095 [Paraphaeosphaeria sporulosa]